MLNPGTYAARAIEGALGLTSTGKEQVAVLFEVMVDATTYERITWYGYFTEKAAPRTIESLRICGWQGRDLTDLTGLNTNVVNLVIEHEPDLQGVVRARVRWINRDGGNGLGLKSQLDGNQAKSFAQRMKGLIAAYDQKAAANGASSGAASAPRSSSQRQPPPGHPASAPAPEPRDEDIPF